MATYDDLLVNVVKDVNERIFKGMQSFDLKLYLPQLSSLEAERAQVGP